MYTRIILDYEDGCYDRILQILSKGFLPHIRHLREGKMSMYIYELTSEEETLLRLSFKINNMVKENDDDVISRGWMFNAGHLLAKKE